MRFKRLILCIVPMLLLASCFMPISPTVSGENSSSSEHTHTFAVGWSNDDEYHWHASTCGDDAVSGKEKHSFEKKSTVEATYDAGGYTVYECSVCHYSENRDETAKLDSSALGINPSFSDDNKSVTYGLYPQTHVSDEELITSLDALTTTASNGWYLYDGAYYAKKSAIPYDLNYTFSDGTTIVNGTEHWFKCEPIEWKVLSSSEGTYSLVSSVLLDAHCYHSSKEERTIDGKTVYANNYEHSDIRKWLNDDFYNSAFALDDSLIQTVTVDNSVSTIGYSANEYACNNTEDKVYLLSYADYKNADYFADDAARCCKPTDWARVSGAWYSTDSSYLGNGYYLTRSPSPDYSGYAWYVYRGGNIYVFYVSYSSYGVRPGIQIKIA